MMRVVRVLVEYAASAINRPFDYLIDDDTYVEKGVRVSINFGNKDIVGYVLAVFDTNKSQSDVNIILLTSHLHHIFCMSRSAEFCSYNP